MEQLVNDGEGTGVKQTEINGQTFTITPGVVSIARLEDEWFEDIKNPELVIATLKDQTIPRPDLLTFWQRLPDTTPRYGYHIEWDNVAALRVKDYEYWWKHQIQSNARGHVRKAAKKGVITRECEFTDDFVQGMVGIFSETPIRQNRPFWHYGKDFHTIKREFSRYLFREQLIGAYYGDELIGFIMLAHANEYAQLGQIISKISHRDKSPNNALLAKAVEVCAVKRIPYLLYAHWPSGSLAEFKRQNGFERIDVPRYYVSLSWRGEIARRLGAHRGWKEMVPERIRDGLRRVRNSWYERRYR